MHVGVQSMEGDGAVAVVNFQIFTRNETRVV